MLRYLLLFVAGSIFLGCGRSTSAGLSSGEIEAVFAISAGRGPDVSCEAVFRQGAGKDALLVELSGGDKVFCSDGVNKVALDAKPAPYGGATYQSTTLVFDSLRKYRMIFERGNSERFETEIALPQPPKILTPAEGINLKKGDQITVTWTKVEQAFVAPIIYWTVDNNDITAFYDKYLEDNGTYTFPDAASLPRHEEGSRVAGAVPIKIQLIRRLAATHPVGLRGSSVGLYSQDFSINLVD